MGLFNRQQDASDNDGVPGLETLREQFRESIGLHDGQTLTKKHFPRFLRFLDAHPAPIPVGFAFAIWDRFKAMEWS